MRKIFLVISLTMLLVVGSAYVLNETSKSRSFQFFGGLVTQVATSEKVVALTFDDGPGVHTDEILRILEEQDVKATFFLTGREMEAHRDEAQKIAKAGHQIGNHSYSHQRMMFKSPTFIREEIERTDQLIRQTGYQGEIPFRPPYGRKLFLLPYYLKQQDRLTILWNIEPETDLGLTAKPEQIVNYVRERIEPGSIILLHVMYESRTASLNAVEGIITALKQEGYSFVTVSELLSYQEESPLPKKP